MVEKYYQQLVRYLTVRLRDSQLAADVAHDAYLKVLEGGRGNTLEYPQAYLYRTALNLVIDGHRRSAIRRSESLDDIDPNAQGLEQFRAPHDSLYLQQRAELVSKALNELSESCRQAFLLRKLDGLAHPEIAARMGISKGMVEKHIVNAMRHCRVRVREMEYSIDDPDDAKRRYKRPPSGSL
ncbi:sigma-70 family RNA polymerase sigma factor [Phytopseudomonas daroniae]|uniref:sigma-70 family RNA polymerase sigma factor n=1 Tax=Phytopseudomonas daroniae TaxID=2487519 RepID=UPI00244AD421|nr:sigma-70 family RNA polymerase sigma factor [Pseudomonas daroniae]